MSTTKNIHAVTLFRGTYPSRSLGCDQPYAYLMPERELNAGGDFPLLVLLHGRQCGYLDWTEKTRIARYAANYRMIIAFPDGDNGWYTNTPSSINGALSGQREDDIIEDFLPHLQQTLPVVEPGAGWGIGGFSMGGYGAIKLALKHPKLFSLALSHSGAFDVTQIPEVHSIFGDREQNAAFRRSESVYWLAEQALCRFPSERPRLLFDCGIDDHLLGASQSFHQHLNFVGYQHDYNEMPGHHTWPYWDRAVRTILPKAAEMLGVARLSTAKNG